MDPFDDFMSYTTGRTVAETEARDELPTNLREAFDMCLVHPRTLLVGVPGSGKTMLARRLAKAIELAGETLAESQAIHVAAGFEVSSALRGGSSPFRAPHLTCSEAAMVGGGSIAPRPGEVSLAHGGVLLLDEVLHFRRTAIEAARQALDKGGVELRRRDGTIVSYPARPRRIVLASTPCPCGYKGGEVRTCTCSASARGTYTKRLGEIAKRFRAEIVRLRPATIEQLVSRDAP